MAPSRPLITGTLDSLHGKGTITVCLVQQQFPNCMKYKSPGVRDYGATWKLSVSSGSDLLELETHQRVRERPLSSKSYLNPISAPSNTAELISRMSYPNELSR